RGHRDPLFAPGGAPMTKRAPDPQAKLERFVAHRLEALPRAVQFRLVQGKTVLHAWTVTEGSAPAAEAARLAGAAWDEATAAAEALGGRTRYALEAVAEGEVIAGSHLFALGELSTKDEPGKP